MATNPDIASLSFEEALKALEDVVRRLESGEAPLDESMDLYERGEKLRALPGPARCGAGIGSRRSSPIATAAPPAPAPLTRRHRHDDHFRPGCRRTELRRRKRHDGCSQPALAQIAEDIDASFDALLAVAGDPRDRLIEAMRYAAIGGGKRLRPLLLTATAGMFGVDRASAVRAGTALEAVHVYSLIHDDLPCMDNDATRHGKPTVHIAYDEATAVLAGDGLHVFAFEVLSDPR
jgi:hypothetical protein